MATIAGSVAAEHGENVEFARPGGVPLSMDYRIPAGPGPFPAAIIVHGGAWVRGDRRTSVEPLFEPLSKAGFAWFSVSYRLISDLQGIGGLAMMGAAVDDVRSAVSFIKAHAAEYRIDQERIALIGESAGAQLASMAALRSGEGGDVRAVVAFYGPSDLADLAARSPMIPESVRQNLKGSPWVNLLLEGLRNQSPVNWVRKDAPPFLLIHGTSDTVVPLEQSQVLCDKLRRTGGTCDVFRVRGGVHGIRWWESSNLTAYKSYMVSWLARELSPARR